MIMHVPETEVRFDITRPAMAQTLFHARATHIPTGTVVTGTGYSLYRVKRDLMDRLDEAVLNHD